MSVFGQRTSRTLGSLLDLRSNIAQYGFPKDLDQILLLSLLAGHAKAGRAGMFSWVLAFELSQIGGHVFLNGNPHTLEKPHWYGGIPGALWNVGCVW